MVVAFRKEGVGCPAVPPRRWNTNFVPPRRWDTSSGYLCSSYEVDRWNTNFVPPRRWDTSSGYLCSSYEVEPGNALHTPPRWNPVRNHIPANAILFSVLTGLAMGLEVKKDGGTVRAEDAGRKDARRPTSNIPRSTERL